MKNNPHSDTINQLRNTLFAGEKLVPVFNGVSFDLGNNSRSTQKSWNASYLSIDNLVDDKANDAKAAFTTDMVNLDRVRLSDYTFFHLAQKYGSRIPADKIKDVSYFDDLRVQKAKEACGDCKHYLLIKGDFSGIQDFIYGGIPIENPGGLRQVSKKLRGKSFFVSVMTDFFAEIILDSLGLPYWNLLFAGGGHFNLLVPFSEENEMAIKEISRIINLQLRGDSDNLLSLALATHKCNDSIFDNALPEMELVNKNRDKIKHRQHFDYLDTVFFQKRLKGKTDDEFAQIGEILPKSDYFILANSDKPFELKTDPYTSGVLPIYSFSMGNNKKTYSLFGIFKKANQHKLEDEAGIINAFFNEHKTTVTEAKVIRLNTFDFLPIADLIDPVPFPVHYAFRLVGKEAPKNKKGELVDFAELAKLQTGIPPDPAIDEQGSIYPQLAVVRLDVDDLGCLFAQGLKNSPDLRHFAALSRELSLFFSGHFNERARKYDMYVVYSGGDDAFAVGNWACTLHFVKDLYEDFKTFTGGNKDLHFSAGIYMCDEHFPVARFADEAGALEEKAKKANDDKNMISVFGQVMGAEQFAKSLDFGETILKYTTAQNKEKSERLTKGLIHRILTLIKRSFHERKEVIDGETYKKGAMKPETFNRHKGSIRYLFARHEFNEKKVENATEGVAREVIKYFIDIWHEDKQTFLKDATVALQYAMYRKRKPKNN